MKFGKQIEVHMVPEWQDYYVPYKKLKRVIKRIKFAKEAADKEEEAVKKAANDSETTPLVKKVVDRSEEEAAKQEFWTFLDSQLAVANQFYFSKMEELTQRIMKVEVAFLSSTTPRGHVHGRPKTVSTDFDRGFAGIQELYDSLVDLRNYVKLNFQGFRKIVKKALSLPKQLFEVYSLSCYSFPAFLATHSVMGLITSILQYDKTLGESESAQFVEKLQEAHFYKAVDLDAQMDILCNVVSRDKLEQGNVEGRMRKSAQDNEAIFRLVKIKPFIASWVIFFVLLFLPLFPADREIEHRCLALLGLVISLWITEALPYFATALLIPGLVVFLQVMTDPNDRSRALDAPSVGKALLGELLDHTSIVILGGYAISAAFAKCQIELYIASYLQRVFGSRPRLFLLAFMYMGLFLSMWISNHTAPVLCVTVLLPIIRDFPRDSPYVKTVLLGLAFSCNLGGMMTPISSLQNALAVVYLQKAGFDVTFGQWMLIATPMCCVGILMCWAFLLFMMNPQDATSIPTIVYDQRPISRVHVVVVVASLTTIGFWALFQFIKPVFGDLGIVAMLFMGFMFGTGILTQFDFNSFSWHLLFLLGGGSILGKAIQSSGLLETVSRQVVSALPVEHVWLVTAYLLVIIIMLTTFVSHTVGAIILTPLVARLAVDLGVPHIPVILSAFAISAGPFPFMVLSSAYYDAMALPFSSFPNVNSLLVEDDNGKPYLSVKDFAKVGIPFQFITLALIATFGYLLVITVLGYDVT